LEAIILTAGKGTRLNPITNKFPKPLIPIGGKPILFHILDNLKNHVDKVILVIGFEADQIQRSVEKFDFPFKIEWIHQKEQLGTGHAVQLCENLINSETFFMFYGDIFAPSRDISSFLELSVKNAPKTGTFAAAKVPNPEIYGCLEVKNDLLIKIHEKSPKPVTNMINAGIMTLPRTIFDFYPEIIVSPRGEIELPDVVNMAILRGFKFSIFLIKEHWTDIGYPWHILEANEASMKELIHGTPESRFNGAYIEGPAEIKNKVDLKPGVYIQGPAFIDENASIGPNCYIRPYSYIGKHVKIGNAVEIKNSIILDNTAIGHLTYIGDSVIGRNCNFGAGTKVANLKLEKNEIKMNIKGERLQTGHRKLGIIMGDGVSTGINVSLMPGIILGENSQIGAHTLVNTDVPANSIYYFDTKKGLIIKKFGKSRNDKKY